MVRPPHLPPARWAIALAGLALVLGIGVARPLDAQESSELEALRHAERELFAPHGPEPGGWKDAPEDIGELPPVVTSDAPEDGADESGHRASEEGDANGWPEGVERPGLPVGWNDRVARFVEFFRDDPRGHRFMSSWLRRAQRYAPMIRTTLREMELPEDLLYVAMIESGFDAQARSHAAAVGMWQFGRRTGAQYGLERTHWVDERMDPEKATEAAARYLRDLHRRFGTWKLALAAYNMGYGALLEAMRKYNTNDYDVLSRMEAALPFETTIYVAKVVAAAVVGTNPERFGYAEAVQQGVSQRPATVRVPEGVPLGLVARAAGIDVERIASLNPELRRQRTPPGDHAYPLRLPAGCRERFQERWDKFRPGRPTRRSYVMRFGERLSDVARRFRTSVARLRRINDLDRDADLGAGSTLLVPDVEPRSLPSDDDESRPVVAIPEPPPEYGKRTRVFYRVTADDTVRSVARFFDVTVDEISRWNQVDPKAKLQPDMLLQLFVPREVDLSRAVVLAEDEVRTLVVGSKAFFDYHEEQRGRVRFRYEVQKNDTLVKIGRRFGLSVGDLARINHFPRDTELRVGQEIIIYAEPDDVPERLIARAGMERIGPADPDKPSGSN